MEDWTPRMKNKEKLKIGHLYCYFSATPRKDLNSTRKAKTHQKGLATEKTMHEV